MATKDNRWLNHWAVWMPASAALGCGLLILVVWLLFPISVLLLVVGWLACVMLGLMMACWWHAGLRTPSLLETPFLLAQDAEVFERYRKFTAALLQLSERRDPIFHELAIEHLDDLLAQAQRIAGGTFLFEGTETWRMIYERLLRSPGLHLYRSVAWVRHRDYWQDEPGRKSMAVNFELNDAERLNIERIAIIADELWPQSETWPTERIRQWLHEQQMRGIWTRFVRESALKNERDLVADIGIYGSRAVGIQELDAECRTVRFTLSFDFEQVAGAEERWNRLAIYAESFSAYLDRYETPG